MQTRRTLITAALGAAVTAASSLSHAQVPAFTRPLRLLVPYAPGGGTDILARLLAEKLRQRLGQPVVVENRPGGNTAIAMRALAEAPPDGHTLLLATTALSTVPAGTPTLFDPTKFTMVGRLSGILLVLVAHPSLPANTIPELIALAKANPGRYSVGTSSIGGSDHLAAELFNHHAGVNIQVVPYKGAAPALNDLLGGQISMRWDAMPSSRPHLEAGRLKALGVAEPKRSPMAPNIPTIAEQGLRGFEVPGYYGIIAPQGTPAPVVNRLNQEFNQIIKLPDVHARMFELGLEPIGSTPAEFDRLVRQQRDFWAKLIKDARIRVE